MKLRACIALTGWIFAAGVAAQEPPAVQDTVSLVREDTDIRQVIKVIAAVSGANIAVAPEVTGTVTLYLREVPWRAALEAAVKAAHARLVEERSGVLRIMGPVAPAPSMTIRGPKSFLTGYPARNPDGTVNVVVEIPAGTLAKWEVDKQDGSLRWEIRSGSPRVVQYLGYPGNYGMVPRTLLPEELGGDGDPLDVIVLGPAVERGSVVKARVIGVLELLDGGEQDDKLLAVMADTPLAAVTGLEQLQRDYPGALAIVETWFKNYKGPGVTHLRGRAGSDRAREILTRAAAAFEAHR